MDHNKNDIVIHENNIEQCLYDICEKEDLDLYTIKQGQWRYVLKTIGNTLFKHTDILKDKELKDNGYILTTSNRYDYKKVNELCDYYISLSDRYNKLVSIIAFSHLSGIDDMTISNWSEPSHPAFGIWKKLNEGRQTSLKDKLFDSNNPVGAMSIGNTEFYWNLPGAHDRRERAEAAPAIPDLERKYLTDAENTDKQFNK